MTTRQIQTSTGKSLILVVLISFLPLLPLLRPGFPQTHDGYEHFVRIAHVAKAFSEGYLTPTWAGNLNQGLGSPLFLYNWLLPYYAVLPMVMLGVPIATAVKIMIAVFAVLSVIGVYLWLRLFFPDRIALTATILYAAAPYQLYNIFVRGAFGEAVALSLVPWLLYTITELMQLPKIRWLIAATLSLSLMILAHHPTALIMIPLLGAYASVYWLKERRGISLAVLMIPLIASFALTFFFWFPALVEMPFSKMPRSVSNVYKDHFLEADRFGTPVRIASDLTSSVHLPEPLTGILLQAVRFSYVTYSLTLAVGTAQMLAALIALFFLLKRRKRAEPFAALFLMMFFGSLFFVTKTSEFLWRTVPLLSSILYPWRFYGIASFAAAYLSAVVVHTQKRHRFLVIGLLVPALIFSAARVLPRPSSFTGYSDTQLINDQGSTDAPGGYLPRWTPNIQDLPIEPPDKIAIAQRGNLETTTLERGTAALRFRAIAQQETEITVNTFFFPAWQAFVDRAPTPIQPSPQGRIRLTIPSGESEVELRFLLSPVRTTALRISWFSLIVITVILVGIWLRSQETRKRVLLVTVSTAISLLIAEGLLRIFIPQPADARCLRADEITHHAFKPNSSCRYQHPDWGSIELQTNSLGLRDREIMVPKPEGTYRILMLGDSFTEGWGVELEATFVKQLEQRLQNKYGATIEVLNAGVLDYSPLLEYLYLRERGLSFDPDLVILNLDANDVSDEAAYYRIAQTTETGTVVSVSEIAGNLSPLRKLHTQLSSFSRLYAKSYTEILKLVKGRLAEKPIEETNAIGKFEADIAVALRETVSPSEAILWHWPKKSLRLIKDLTENNRIPLLLVVYPYGVQVNGTEWPGRVASGFELGKTYPTRYLDSMEQFAADEGIPIVNMLDAFRSSKLSPLYHSTDGHFSPAGHRVFAEELSGYLTTNAERFGLRE